jgi:hypothetical protein
MITVYLNDPKAMLNARIFISSGQRDDEERRITKELKNHLIELGYEPYVAIEEQSTRPLIENILNILKDSEYFLFVDFKREKIVTDMQVVEFRGSLFTNQELAVAIYLHKEIIGFQEEKVRKLDGMLGAIQGNVESFKENARISLVPTILKKIQSKWIPDWRNELIVENKDEEEIVAVPVNYHGRPCRFFHISIRNLHKDKSSRNCMAYVESYRKISKEDLENKELLVDKNSHPYIMISEPVELKWKGVTTQGTLITPKTSRKFDAVYVYEDSPNTAHIGINESIVDYSGYYTTLSGPGKFELNLAVYSDNFSSIKQRFILIIGNTIEDIKFYRISNTMLIQGSSV